MTSKLQCSQRMEEILGKEKESQGVQILEEIPPGFKIK